MATTVGVRELRQNLSKYLTRVKDGEDFVVTERGREVARLTPSGPEESAIDKLVRDHGATRPIGRLVDYDRAHPAPPNDGPPSSQVLDELREERL